MAAQVGNGAVFTLAPGAIAFDVISIEFTGMSVPVLDTTHLGTTGFRTKKSGKLKEPPTAEMTFFYDPDHATKPDALVGVLDTDATITFPVDGQGTPGDISGSGFISDLVIGNLESDVLSQGTLTFQFDGDGKDPTFTASSV